MPKVKVVAHGRAFEVPLNVYIGVRAFSICRAVRRSLFVPFEWLGIFLGIIVFSSVSHRRLFALCDAAAAVMYRFDRRGRRRSFENLAVVRPNLAKTRAETIVRGSYRNMARTVGHVFWTFRDARRRVAEVGELSAGTVSFLKAHRPAVTVSAHIGCWEVLSQLAFLDGHEMMSVAKDIGTAGMTRLLMRARKSIGQEIVPADGAFRSLMKGIRDGKSLGLLVDQTVDPADGGIWVRFFGRPLPVSAAPAFFAAKAKAPIIVAWSRPLPGGRYRCEKIDEIMPEDARDIWATTQRCAADIERIIRRHPARWVLNYNFFRFVPSADELATLQDRESGKRDKR